MKLDLKYHHDTISLLQESPRFSQSADKLLCEREQQLGIQFPAAVREWYSLDGAVELLKRHSNDDWPVELAQLGEPYENWYDGGPKDFLAESLLLFLHENQGVCNWAIKLDGSSDPAVVVEVDTAPDPIWLPCADRFSTFVWCQIWDHLGPGGSHAVFAQEEELSRTDLDLLRSRCRQRPTTTGWPGKSNYRFENDDGRILIWDGQERGVDWSICAETIPALKSLLSLIWKCGNLAKSLYADGKAERVLAELRDR